MKNYPLYDANYYNNFRDFLYGISENNDKIALTYYDRKGAEYTITYNKLAADSLCFAQYIMKTDLCGKHIAIVGENCYEWLVAFLGITACGSVAVTVDIEQSSETIQAMIIQADCSAIVASSPLIPICSPLLVNNSVSQIVFMTDGNDAENSLTSLCNLSGVNEIPPKESFTNNIDGSAPAAIVYTSGTTSTSKPVLLTHIGILTNIADGQAYITSEPKIFTSLPFYHTYGLNSSVLANFLAGVNICINGDMKTLTRDMKAFGPGSLMAVPLLVETLHKMLWLGIEKAGKKDAVLKLVNIVRKLNKLGINVKSKTLIGIKESGLGDLRTISCGGAHISNDILEELKTFGLLILEGYGITECSPLISVNRNKYYRFSSVGLIAPHGEVKIVDDEIYVRGPFVMKEYYKRPEETASVFEGEWFKTGDLGYIDKKGFLYITGRKKNLIVLKNGKKISPEEIENALKNILLIKEVMAYGASSGISTDDVKLAIMVYPDPELSKDMTSYEILEHIQKEVNIINTSLPSYKQIQMINLRDTEFSKTSSKKIKRQSV